ncbi:hypothetical protein [Pseudovibrio sp. Tun.PSC04-5.I4]|uniref:hypothetical protein n=1 Tax=Pseudovibrio sp. Tun.PSC04-5.I4 TaxID=1798213 RepID=UPI00088A5211|nr:hypothetical protein [Pseudovibrio sp. Tun.PSC04-5.I4]SDR10139.1 hypothetical protein SAMN04515695_2768 [Pseudovibrio sp. Tun.PSC04-5.I4]
MNDIDAINVLRVYRNEKTIFPAGTIIRFRGETPEDLGHNIGIVDRETALAAALVDYIDKAGFPQQAVVAISNLEKAEVE